MANPKQATNGSSNGHNNGKGTPENKKGTPESKPAVMAAGIKNGVKPNEEEHHLPNGNLVKKQITSLAKWEFGEKKQITSLSKWEFGKETNNITCQMGIW